MLNRIFQIVTCGTMLLVLNGCLVAKSTYLQKVEESDGLAKEKDALLVQRTQLTEENSALKTERDRLKNDLAGLTKDKQALIADKQQLESVLTAKSDTLSKTISELRDKSSRLEADIKRLETENGTLKSEIARLQKVKEEKLKEVSSTYEQLLQNMKNEISQGQVTISELKGKLTVNMQAAILFDSGKADVKTEGLEILSKMIDTLKGVKDKAIRIEGHTDNVQIIGALARVFPTNWELSAARAINVVRYLQQQGVDPALLSAAAYAEHRPVADNDSKEGQGRNRRIEITLVARD